MKVVILAGGLPSTVSEEDEKIPKPMAEIGGRPILWHIMKSFCHFGFHDFIICAGYKGAMIKQYFMDYYIYGSDITVDLQKNTVEILRKKTENWNVTVVDTGLETPVTKRIELVKDYIGEEPFIVAYGDCVSDIDISKLVEQHITGGKLATVAVARPTGRNGIMPIGEDGLFSEDNEKTQADAWVNACTYVFEQGIFEYLDSTKSYMEQGLFNELAREQLVCAYKHQGFWSPMETRRDRSVLERMWNEGKAPWKTWRND